LEGARDSALIPKETATRRKVFLRTFS
jgi:hypothetical protein